MSAGQDVDGENESAQYTFNDLLVAPMLRDGIVDAHARAGRPSTPRPFTDPHAAAVRIDVSPANDTESSDPGMAPLSKTVLVDVGGASDQQTETGSG